MTSQAPLQIKVTVGRNLARARRERGWTQRQLAYLMDVDTNAISRWERGEVLPTPTRFMNLARHLDHSIAWFYTEHPTEAAA